MNYLSDKKYSKINLSREKLIAKIFETIVRGSGTISVIFIIQRLQNDRNGLDDFTFYLLSYSPSLSTNTSAMAYNLFRYFIIPVLIFRTYKRLQYFNHSIHIALIISFFMMVIDEIYYSNYFYLYVLVVLAMPLFPP